ncbi:hypothetical protein PWT90_02368 [Aphanocladium album]|nr:hypothetical protein PWT90_02368 [Aphanocladium album]
MAADDPKARDTPLSPAKVRSRDTDNRLPSPSSGAVIPSPPTENEAGTPPRQKRWATKTRRMCDGYKAAPKKPSKETAMTATYGAGQLQSSLIDSAHAAYNTGLKPRSAFDWSLCDAECSLIPPDWDLVEAFDYYYRTILPSLNANHLDESTALYQPTASNLGCKTSFITFVFSNRIADAAKNRGTLRSPEEMPYDQYLWTAFHASMINMLAIINVRLSSKDGSINDSVFVRIVDMLSIDLTLLGSTWQAHLHGYGALYKMRGGYKRLSKVLRDYDRQFQYVFMLHVFTSTTTPAAQILTIFDDLTPEEVHHVFTFSLYSDVPCSSHVFADLIRINRLRALVAAGASISRFVRPATRQIYNHIAEFSVDSWEEPYGVPDKPEMRLLCRVYQKAVLLYGLLTLPPLPSPSSHEQPLSPGLPSPATSGAEAGGSAGCAPHESDGEENVQVKREEEDEEGEDDAVLFDVDDGTELLAHATPPTVRALRDEILALVREVLPLIEKRPTSLSWPLAVVGVTLTRPEDAAEREFVQKTLYTVSTHRDAYYGPTLGLEKLRAFWASGKTTWEECFDEPCSVIA